MTNTAISKAAAATWANPKIAAARSKRYAAAMKVGRKVTEYKSVGAALRSLGMDGSRGVRGAMMKNGGYIQLDVDGRKVMLALRQKEHK
jgi:hypothetical protein